MDALIIFTKYPGKGKVKTRLGKTIGDDSAAEISKLISEHIFNVCLSLPENDYKLFLFYDDPDSEQRVIKWVSEKFLVHLQEGNDLGEKMKNAFDLVFENGYSRVLIIGTDVPDINFKLLLNAFNSLAENNIVIGPAFDGGYYLLGMDKFYHFLFNDIEWSSEKVLRQTLSRIAKHKLSYQLLPELIDIDTQDDLNKWLSCKTKQ